MNPTVQTGTYNLLFAAAPFAVLLAIVVAAYLAKRHESAAVVPIGQTFACGNCGRRSHREHMVPQTNEGAVSWFCARCIGTH